MSGAATDHRRPAGARREVSFATLRAVLPLATGRWERGLVVGSAVAAALAIWLTLRAGFLAYPGWLAAQKADFILGPILVGLYWRYKRPNNRLGLLLIILGLCGVLYILESANAAVLFGIGIFTENAIYLMTSLVILSFPSGRLEWVGERVIVAAILIGVVLTDLLLSLSVPDFGPGFSISGCRPACPANGLAVWSAPSWLSRIAYSHVFSVAVVLIPLATIGILVRRFIIGSPPRRRALAIGAPIALLFLLMQASYRALFLISPNLSPSEQPVHSALQWTFAGSRAFIWYGFLFALIAAEVYAGHVLRTLVGEAVQHPAVGELEVMLRGPLGDPGLRLGFWDPAAEVWVDAHGAVLAPEPGQDVTAFERETGSAIGIAHDAQLSDEPELLEAAAEVAILALEHVELETAQRESLNALVDSRTRLVETSDRERRRLERDLHDGAQQRLTAIQIRLRLAMERTDDEQLVEQLEAISADAEEAIDELRELSHGIYPTVLRSAGPVMALRALAMRTPIPVTVADGGIGRCSSSVEAAIYFCGAEAIQNAIKHAGDGATVAVSLGRDSEGIRFRIADDGVGMAETNAGSGDGLAGMRDRIGAVGGELEIRSAPGQGTTVEGSIPDQEARGEP
jgi:signal transduction histidine kinase